MVNKPLVLVVDDDALMRELYGEALSEDFALHFALDGLDALAQLRDGPRPSAVLMDVAMPGLDGYETCRHLHKENADAPPVIFVSSNDRLEDRMRGYDAGGNEYLCKPVEAIELVTKIRRQIQADMQHRALHAEHEEAVMAVLSSADLAGELGVVLDFQRGLNSCSNSESLGRQLFEALARYSFEGCARIYSRGASRDLSSSGACTALEHSILDALVAQREGPRIRPFQSNTSFNFGTVVLFVRRLAMQRDADMAPEESQRQGRAIDNIALLMEAAVSRLQAIEGEGALQDLGNTRRLIGVATQAMHDVAQRNERMAEQVRQAFESLQSEMDVNFIHLGLSSSQEESVSELIRSHGAHVQAVLEQNRATEQVLRRVILDLKGGG